MGRRESVLRMTENPSLFKGLEDTATLCNGGRLILAVEKECSGLVEVSPEKPCVPPVLGRDDGQEGGREMLKEGHPLNICSYPNHSNIHGVILQHRASIE